jgi:hypothetical protein
LRLVSDVRERIKHWPAGVLLEPALPLEIGDRGHGLVG